MNPDYFTTSLLHYLTTAPLCYYRRMNLIDLLILFSFLVAIWDGWKRGLLALVFDLLSLGLSVWLAFQFYAPLGSWLGERVGLSEGLRSLIAFGIVLFLTDGILRFVFGILIRLIPGIFKSGLMSRTGGVAAGLVKQFVVTAVLLNLLLFLPVIPAVRTSIQASASASYFVTNLPALEQAFATLITPAVKELQEFTTITKITDHPVEIDTPVEELAIDEAAEAELFRLVNKERQERGLGALVWSDQLSEVGRVHSKDMWVRQFFAHVNPDGQDPFDRIDAAGITYVAAGENLALAPSTPIAHQGLMDSPGHRENILNTSFGTLGIGAVRNGLYGVMYTQVFTN